MLAIAWLTALERRQRRPGGALCTLLYHFLVP